MSNKKISVVINKDIFDSFFEAYEAYHNYDDGSCVLSDGEHKKNLKKLGKALDLRSNTILSHMVNFSDFCECSCIDDDLSINDKKSEYHDGVRLLNLIAKDVNNKNKNWWVDINTGQKLDRNIGELLMLCVSELAEAMEGHRKNLMDDKLPHRKMFEVEIADTFIRLFDLAGGLGLDISGAISEKLEYNSTRSDHKIENRLKENGKKY